MLIVCVHVQQDSDRRSAGTFRCEWGAGRVRGGGRLPPWAPDSDKSQQAPRMTETDPQLQTPGFADTGSGSPARRDKRD